MPRPVPTFRKFVGHKKAVDVLRRQLEGAKSRGEPFPTTLFSGPSGVGKTLLAESLAEEYGTQLIESNGHESLEEFAKRFTTAKFGDIVFVDEAHRASPSVQELLYDVIDKQRVPQLFNRPEESSDDSPYVEINPCTVIVATDQPGKLMNALIKRAELHIPLGFYPLREMREMPDPQRGDVVPLDDPSRLQIVPGCLRLGLQLVVFHDQLSDEFVKEQSNSSISFVRVETDRSQSVNDQRFVLFRDWLSRNFIEKVFCSDGFDVRVNRNPFPMIDDSSALWAGVHRDWTIDEFTLDGRYVLRMMQSFYGQVPDEVYRRPILMAGTWGGRYCEVLRTLVLLVNEIDTIHKTRPSVNCNLAAFNRVVYRDIGHENVWMKGAPLHSEFRAFDYDADVAFVHK